jgi:drug/metabolite transporter (DMT)-like permease
VNERGRAGALLEGLFAVAVWGGSFIATKIAVAEVPPALVVWLRFAIGVAILGAAAVARRVLAPLPARELAYLALLGAVGISLHQWLQSNALVTARASTSGWIIAATPVFIAALAWAALGERLGPVRVAGIAVAAAGVVLVVTRGDLGALLHGRFGDPGDLLMLLSSPNWAVFSVLSRRAMRARPAALVLFWIMLAGWLFTSAHLFATTGIGAITSLSARGWLAVAFLGVACSGLAYIAWFDALERLPASQVGALLYLEPLVAMLVAAAALGEPVGPVMLLGGAVILVGVWLVNRPARPDPLPAPES